MKIAKMGVVDLGGPAGLIEFTFWIDQQRYALMEIEDDYLRWETRCPECGNKFVVESPRVFEGITRRCQFHRGQGGRVKDTSLCVDRDNADQPLP